MLCERFSVERLRTLLLPRAEWMPFPPASDRAAWEALSREPLNRTRRDHLVDLAARQLAEPWPDLPATLFMDYARTGDRCRFETRYFLRRQRLGVWTLAECFEHRGRFVDAIADALWALAEETTWCVPAHVWTEPREPLPSAAGAVTVDLFAAETAHLLAQVCCLLRDELDAVTPVLRRRIREELLRRVIGPVETRDDIGWFSGRNNWSPWCASNVLGAAFYTLDDPARLAALTHRMMGVTDRFLAHQLPDGGCDEGPMYWSVAGGALLIFLELLHSRSRGAIDVYAEPLVRAVGEYFAKVHLEGPWFAAFADAAARTTPRVPVVYRYGERIGSEPLQRLALAAARGWDPAAEPAPTLPLSGLGGDLMNHLWELFWMPAQTGPVPPPARPADVWLPDLQVMVARTAAGPASRGFSLAAKGGHNAENHNHNDVGQFILLFNGEPVIVDAGRGTYTRETFGPRRYDAWFIRGSGHNVPVVGGVEQQAGAEFAAGEVVHAATPEESRLSLRLDGAYPAAAGLGCLRRDVVLRRADPSVRIADAYELKTPPGEITLALLTPAAVTAAAPGRLHLETGRGTVELAFPADRLDCRAETVELDDAALVQAWGPRLTRLVFTHRPSGLSGGYELEFRESRA